MWNEIDINLSFLWVTRINKKKSQPNKFIKTQDNSGMNIFFFSRKS